MPHMEKKSGKGKMVYTMPSNSTKHKSEKYNSGRAK